MSEQSKKVSSDPKTSNGKENSTTKCEAQSEIVSTSLSTPLTTPSVANLRLPAFANPLTLTSSISSTSSIGSQSGFFSSMLSSSSSSSTTASTSSSSSSSGFVFGQNLHEKITSSSCTTTNASSKSSSDGDKETSDSGSEAASSSSTTASNGGNGLGLFSAALQTQPKSSMTPSFASSSNQVVSSSTTTATTPTIVSKSEQSTISDTPCSSASSASSTNNNSESAKTGDAAKATNDSANEVKTESNDANKNESPSTSKPDEPSSGMLFCDLLKTGSKNGGSVFAASNSNNKRSLSEAAIECEESRPQKRKPEEITVVTGEEDETNMFQTNCKIFAFDSATKAWKERGNAVLRLNDKSNSTATSESRIIARSLGIQKIILNTKIWGDMTIEKANVKSIRFTAIDHQSGDIKIFLISMNPEKMKDLYELIKLRIVREQSRVSQIKNECKPIEDGKVATASA